MKWSLLIYWKVLLSTFQLLLIVSFAINATIISILWKSDIHFLYYPFTSVWLYHANLLVILMSSGGVFKLELFLPEEYPMAAPKVFSVYWLVDSCLSVLNFQFKQLLIMLLWMPLWVCSLKIHEMLYMFLSWSTLF